MNPGLVFGVIDPWWFAFGAGAFAMGSTVLVITALRAAFAARDHYTEVSRFCGHQPIKSVGDPGPPPIGGSNAMLPKQKPRVLIHRYEVKL